MIFIISKFFISGLFDDSSCFFILISNSFFETNNLTTAGIITGTNAM